MMKETLSENGIQYSLHGDYYIPDLKLEPESPRRSSGPHAQRLSEVILSNSSQSAYSLR